MGLPCYLGLNSCGSVSMKINKTRKHFFQKQSWHAACFPNVSTVSHTGNIASSVRFLFQDVDYTYATRRGILTKIRACQHLQKFCEHEQASTHLIIASNSSKGKILRALSNWMGPLYTPRMNVVARCTMNTNGGTETHWALAPVKS